MPTIPLESAIAETVAVTDPVGPVTVTSSPSWRPEFAKAATWVASSESKEPAVTFGS